MDLRFAAHNSHLDNAATFSATDPQLRRLAQRHFQYRSPLIDQLPAAQPGIYSLGGGRQIGKSTLLKQWMAELLANAVPPAAIAFFTGKLIDDHHSLLALLQAQLAAMPADQLTYVFLDEVSYIRDWDKAVKFAADAGMLENTVLLLTGSDLAFIQEARMRFPGRRGDASSADFHMYPLSFYEYLSLKNPIENLDSQLQAPQSMAAENVDLIYKEFQQYLLHGGYLTAINDMAERGEILPATLNTYSDWIRGDMLKRGKQEQYLREILAAIIKRYSSQITWNSLASDLSIDHPKTVADYIRLLESMDAVFVQSALLEDKLSPAPKKAKKLMFCDPFILHATRAWIEPDNNPFQQQIVPLQKDPVWLSKLVESCVACHFRRFYPTYYIKAQAEVDIAYVYQRKFWPIEIKWTRQLHPKELKQIGKYSNGVIWSRSKQYGDINGIKTLPLPIALLRVGMQK